MDLQFHVAGEDSQSWWKSKDKSYMMAGKKEKKGVSHCKTIKSHEAYYQENS